MVPTNILPTLDEMAARVVELEGCVTDLQRVVEILARHLVATDPTALRADLQPFGLTS